MGELFMWRADQKKWEPVRVLCPKGLHPEKDADGEPIFLNTHFKKFEDALKNLWDNAMGYMKLQNDRIEVLERTLKREKDELVTACRAFAKRKLRKAQNYIHQQTHCTTLIDNNIVRNSVFELLKSKW